MTVVVLHPPSGGPPPDPRALTADGRAPVLLTGTGAPPGTGGGYAEAHAVERYATTAAVELAVLRLADRTGVTAVVALHPADQVRAGSLRDHLGLPGPSRAAARVAADPVRARELLLRAGVPVVPRAEVRTVLDLYRCAHALGYPLVVRRRRPGRQVVAELADEAALRAFAAGGLTTGRCAAAGLTAEPPRRGEQWRGPGLAVNDAALAALPAAPGHPYSVEAVRPPGGGWLVDSVGYAPDALSARELARAQAGLEPSTAEAV